MSLSPRAEAALLRCVYLGINPTVESLRKAYSGTGRDMWLKVLRELKDIGFVAEKTYRIGQRFETKVWVTEAGFDYVKGSGFPTLQPTSVEVGFSDPLIQRNKLYSPYSKTSLTSKELWETHKEEEFVKVNLEVDGMGSWGGMFNSTESDDEQKEEYARAQREKKAAYQEAKQKKHENKIIHRSNVPHDKWTISDVSYEFIHRTQMIWGMKVWTPDLQKMNGAFSKKRLQYETNGEIEVQMLDLFFSAINFDKYNDPNVLWKMFASRWGEFASQATSMVRSEEEVISAKLQAEKSQEWLYE